MVKLNEIRFLSSLRLAQILFPSETMLLHILRYFFYGSILEGLLVKDLKHLKGEFSFGLVSIEGNYATA